MMQPDALMSALSLVLSVMGLVPAVRKKLTKLVEKIQAQPGAADRKRLVEFCELLNQRRVFYANYNSEVVELCTGSLKMLQDETTKRIAALEHPGARAMLEAVQDHLRVFIDRRGDFRLGHRGPGPELTEFFLDLGTLRERVRICTEGIALMAPNANALKADENVRQP
jgi:hypothetical protein